jgi:4-amino-4-deoxy-L-arabinose transferase-like glycosyltransferase
MPGDDVRSRGRARHALLVAAGYVALHSWGLDWGVPSFTGWIPDELLPGDVVRGVEHGFGGGWHERYPPLHYYLLALLDGLLLWLRGVPARNPLPADVHTQMFLLGRLVSLAMGAATAALVYLCGARLYNAAAGALAAAIYMGMPTLAFHTRLATLDVPYVFWWALSLLFALRALATGRRRELLAFGLAAALAVTTKDQAYALYVLPWPILLLLLRRQGRPLTAGDVLAPAALSAAVFALVHRVSGNTDGFVAHVELMLGPASEPFRQFPRTLAGELGLALETVRQLAASLGLPAFALGVAGLVGLALRRGGGAGERFLLASAAAYHLTFISVVLYCYDRFVLPLGLILALVGAGALVELARRGRVLRGIALAAALGLVALSAARGLAIGRLLARDSRYAAERWLHAHVQPGERVGFVGAWKDLPRPEGLRARSLQPYEAQLETMRPRYVVCNLNRAAQVKPGDREAPFYERLAAGRLGYALVWRWREPLAWPLSVEWGALAEGSNLFWVNPELAIYERADTRD